MASDSETDDRLVYKRVLLKLSGEALMGPSEFGIHMPTCLAFAEEIAGAIRETGVELCLVIGGGNIFRGLAGAAAGMAPRCARERASAAFALAFVSACAARHERWR